MEHALSREAIEAITIVDLVLGWYLNVEYDYIRTPYLSRNF